MFKSLKAQLRKISRMMAEWPVVGRSVKIGVAIIRLPEIRDAYLVLNQRQHVLETERIPALQEAISALGHRQQVLETEQIPALQSTISALNHRQHGFETERIPALQESISSLNNRQLSSDNNRDNLVKSVPVALRKITRELADIRNRLESATNSNGRHISEV